MEEDNKKAREESQKSIESVNKNIESTKGELGELSKKMDENN